MVASEQEIIEKIDIGGISLIRAAAKNYKDVLCVSSMEDYTEFLELINTKGGESTIEDRRHFAAKAFNVSSHYDTAIFNYFNKDHKEAALKISETRAKVIAIWRKPTSERILFW